VNFHYRQHCCFCFLLCLAVLFKFSPAYAVTQACENLFKLSPQELASSVQPAKDPLSHQSDHSGNPGNVEDLIEFPCTPVDDDGEHKHACDVENTVQKDQVIDSTARLVIVNSDHVLGSGAWDNVFIYGCRNGGQITTFFNKKYLYGATVQSVSSKAVTIKYGFWSGKDAGCCASHEAISVYQWDPKTQRFEDTNQQKIIPSEP
jgi:hypothetical protein